MELCVAIYYQFKILAADSYWAKAEIFYWDEGIAIENRYYYWSRDSVSNLSSFNSDKF